MLAGRREVEGTGQNRKMPLITTTIATARQPKRISLLTIDFGGGLKAESDLKLKQKIKYMLHELFKISLSFLGLGLLTP